MRRFRFFVLLAAVAAFVGTQAATPPPARAASGPPQIAIVTSLGTIDVVLDPAHAPITVRNFLRLVDRKFFDGGTFFRSVPGFVIQGGNKARESERDTPIALEPPAKTGLRNLDGAIAMARTSDPNSATSEFSTSRRATRRSDTSPRTWIWCARSRVCRRKTKCCSNPSRSFASGGSDRACRSVTARGTGCRSRR
jgi:cyclophilin family peptidyl-prolyl cis-trans isomerase